VKKITRNSNYRLIVAVLFVSVISPFPLFAHVPGENPTLKSLMIKADVVFYGQISKIDYADPSGLKTSKSKGTRRWAPILDGPPHTFVTYRVIKEIYGSTGKKYVTLRFYGGPDGKGALYDSSASATFIKGERQVVMIKGNGRLRMPLVLGELGQFREYRGGVYSSIGVALTRFNKKGWVIFEGGIHPKLSLKIFPTPSFEGLLMRSKATEIISQKGMSIPVAKVKYEKEAPPYIVTKRVQQPRTAPAKPVSMNIFVSKLQAIARKLPTPRARFVSQDPRQRFVFKGHVGIQAPQTIEGTATYNPNRWVLKSGGPTQ